MSQTLSQLSTSLSHIHEQFQSSYDSVLFVHGLLSAFYNDLTSTNLTRQAQVQSMSTTAGIQLRKIIINLHSHLAQQLSGKIGLYGGIAKELKIKAHQIKQAVKQAVHQNKNLEQNQNFIKAKTTRIDSQVNRLAKISQNLQRDLYFNNLKQKFFLNKNDQNMSVNNNLPHENIKQINHKLQGYINQHRNILHFVQSNYPKSQAIINQLVGKLNTMEHNAGDFSKIYQLIHRHKESYNGNLKNNGAFQKLTPSNNELKHNRSEQKYNYLGSVFSNGSNQQILNCRQVLSAGTNRISQASRQISTAMKNFNVIGEDTPNSYTYSNR